MKITPQHLTIGQTSDSPNYPTPPRLLRRDRIFFPFAILFLMLGSLFLLDAVLPLRELWFHEALLTQLGSWPVFPSLLLFPGRTLIPPVNGASFKGVPVDALSWLELPLLLTAFLLVFLVYLLALSLIPQRITQQNQKRLPRYIFYSTLLIGFLFTLVPIVTSSDIFSYIAYARLGVLYHLNPQTALPTAISRDGVYGYLYWINQPSAYGPSWTLITSSLQWLLSVFGTTYVLPMVLALRLLGLAMHLGSTLLIWSISGHLQRNTGILSPRKRTLATLAFAWNPLLLFEACVNAHSDTTLLFFILLAISFLVQTPRPTTRGILLAVILFAIATCVKITIVVLFPGLLLFIFFLRPPDVQDIRFTATKMRTYLRPLAVTGLYVGTIGLLYLPFLHGGSILNVFFVNPGTSLDINTPADFFGHLYNTLASVFGSPIAKAVGSPAERETHTLSICIFLIIYVLLFLRATRLPYRLTTLPDLIRWWAVTWLLFCIFGSPWFWPWYAVTFFGLFALLEACNKGHTSFSSQARAVSVRAGTRLLTFSLLTIYCFHTWGPAHTFVPGLPGFLWAYFRGLWAWALPLLGFPISYIILKYHSAWPELADKD